MREQRRKAEQVASGQWLVASEPSSLHPSSSNPQSLIPNPPRAFTLVELLVTITIIGILAAMVLGALHSAGNTARESATKATIVKLNSIIMQRYESYMTRRVPIRLTPGTPPKDAAWYRLRALRQLMRLEMPDSLADIYNPSGGHPPPAPLQYWPALTSVYFVTPPTNNYESAQCLYLAVSRGSPEAMEQFNQSEIGIVEEGGVKHPVFIDGWGTPICWLRWAPGYSSRPGTPVPDPFGSIPKAPSDIQTGNASADPDPFDPRRVDVDGTTPRAFHLIPLICSAGTDKSFGLIGMPISTTQSSRSSTGPVISDVTAIFGSTNITVGAPDTTNSGNIGTHSDNITNHHIEQR